MSSFRTGVFWSDGGAGKQSSPACTTTAKVTTILQNNYRPESLENQTVWKSNNQGIKEVTFIQKSKKGRDAETWNGQSHAYMWWIKIGKDNSAVRDPSPTPDHTAQGSMPGR